VIRHYAHHEVAHNVGLSAPHERPPCAVGGHPISGHLLSRSGSSQPPMSVDAHDPSSSLRPAGERQSDVLRPRRGPGRATAGVSDGDPYPRRWSAVRVRGRPSSSRKRSGARPRNSSDQSLSSSSSKRVI
jgi:hypothetical protein